MFSNTSFKLQQWQNPHDCFTSHEGAASFMQGCDEEHSWWTLDAVQDDFSFKLREHIPPNHVLGTDMWMHSESDDAKVWWQVVDFIDGRAQDESSAVTATKWFRLQEKGGLSHVLTTIPCHWYDGCQSMQDYWQAGDDSWWRAIGETHVTPPVANWELVMCHDGGPFEEKVTHSVVTSGSVHADVEFSQEISSGVELGGEGAKISEGLKDTLSLSFGVEVSQEDGTSIEQTVQCPNPGCLYQFTISGDGGSRRWNSPHTACTSAHPPPCPPLAHLNGSECVETTSVRPWAPGNSSSEIRKIKDDASTGEAVMV